MTEHYLEFERPVIELEKKIEALKLFESQGKGGLSDEIRKLEQKARKLQREIFRELDPWQKVQLSRHARRPYTLDYLPLLVDDFVELHGDRRFGDDAAIVAGVATYHKLPVVVIGHQKGRGTKENLFRNFGMSRPEGYRKAIRLMHLAERFRRPILTLIDTPGAFPGIDAEERGQAQAIAESLEVMASLTVPLISIIIGEGGSGGALALGMGNRVLMLEYGIYSVISPEGCASILFKDTSRAPQAAAALQLTADALYGLGVIDEIIEEAPGGAHRDAAITARNIDIVLSRHLEELRLQSPATLRQQRHDRLRHAGVFTEPKG